jgi:hypothetical protein
MDDIREDRMVDDDINNKYWQDLCRERLKKNPLCEGCMSHTRVENAIDVYRIPALEARYQWWICSDFGRLISLCASCYEYKRRADAMSDQPFDPGCGLDGYPVDPRHSWYNSLARLNRSRE